MSIEKVREYFKKYGIENKIIEFDGDTSTVTLAAKCLGVTDGEIAKSLSFKVNDEPILIIAKGDARIDNKKYKDYFKVKAKMLSFDEVEELIGHKVGGVCPFAIKENVKVYLDISLKEYEFVYPACGSSHSCIKLSIEEMEKYSGYIEWVDVCKTLETEVEM